MPNDSSTGGYLPPAVTSPPLEDNDLDVFLQSVVKGVAGLSDVRPRWQPTPANVPKLQTTNWCAIGVIEDLAEPGSVPFIHLKNADGGLGADEMQRQEVLTVLASFYGTAARSNAKLLRDGIYVAQNREAMRAAGMALVDVDPMVVASELVGQNWRRRYDLPIRFRRMVVRLYPVRNLLSASGTIKTDAPANNPLETEFNVEEP